MRSSTPDGLKMKMFQTLKTAAATRARPAMHGHTRWAAGVVGVLVIVVASGWIGAASAVAQCTAYVIASSPATYLPGTADIDNHGDEAMTLVELPFAVSFYGTSYTNVNISSNGFAEFGGDTQDYAGGCLPTGTFTSPVMFAYWGDLGTSGPGKGVFTAVSGSPGSRTFVIEWRAGWWSESSEPPSLLFEIILYEGQSYFDFVYSAVGSTPQDTVGVQSAAGDATQFECQSGATTLTAGTSLRFTCGAVVGACCAPTGGCTLVLVQSQCVAPSTFVSGGACSPSPCPPPSNDACANATDLNSVSFPYSAAIYNASAADDTTDCSAIFHSVWFTYTATEPTLLPCTGSEFTLWAVAPDCTALPQCSNDNIHSIVLNTGETAKFLVGSDLPLVDANNVITVNIERASLNPPPNDSCAGAVDLNAAGLPYSTTIYNVNATEETTDCSGLFNGVWFTYTASTQSVLVCSSLSSQVAVWATAADCTGVPHCAGNSDVSIALAPGQTIRILAGSDTPTIALDLALRLTFTLFPQEPNDICANAASLNSVTFPYTVFVDHRGATDDTADCGVAPRGVWFTYTAPQDCMLKCSWGGFAFTESWAFAPDCTTTPVCFDNLQTNRFAVRVNAGQTMKIIATDRLGILGRAQLRFDMEPFQTDSSCGIQVGSAPFISGTTDVDNHSNDGAMTTVAFPFPVQLYGNTYTSGNVSSFGFVEFGAAVQSSLNHCLPTNQINATAIFAYWDSMSTQGSERGIFTRVDGPPGAQTFVIEWRTGPSIEVGSEPPTYRFEVVFFENQPYFDLRYDLVPELGTHTVGVQARGAGPATQFEAFPSFGTQTVWGNSALSAGMSLRIACASVGPVGACCDNITACSVVTQGTCAQHNFYPGSTCSAAPCPALLPNDSCAGAIALHTVPMPFHQQISTWLTTPDPFDSLLLGGVWYTYTAQGAGTLAATSVSANQHVQFVPQIEGCNGTPDYDHLGFDSLSLDLAAGQTTVIVVGLYPEIIPSYDVTFSFTPVCLGDFNGSGSISVQDIFDFLGAYFGNNPRADVNGSGTVSVQDIFDFLGAYFAGC